MLMRGEALYIASILSVKSSAICKMFVRFFRTAAIASTGELSVSTCGAGCTTAMLERLRLLRFGEIS